MIKNSDWKNIIEIVEQLNIPRVYKECIVFGIKKIYKIMPFEPVFIGLCGSAAREDIVLGFSDIDLLFIHSGDVSYNILNRYIYNGIKVGLTILPNDFSAPQYQDRKPWYFFRCLQRGIYKKLYGNMELLPKVTLKKLYLVTAGTVNLKSLQQLLSNDIQENILSKSLKHCHTIMKNIIFLEHKKELEGYKAIHKYFYENFNKHFTRVPSVQEFIIQNQTSNFLKVLIKEFLNDFSTYLKDKFFIL